MEVMVERCCGIDVHQKNIVCCILDGPLDTNQPKKFNVPLVHEQLNFENVKLGWKNMASLISLCNPPGSTGYRSLIF